MGIGDSLVRHPFGSCVSNLGHTAGFLGCFNYYKPLFVFLDCEGKQSKVICQVKLNIFI